MKNLRGLSIERVIVHILDCTEEGETIYSDEPIELSDENFVLPQYFQDQIISVSQDEDAGRAVLADEHEGDIGFLYDQIISMPEAFVPTSKKLGERLYEIMFKDHRIAPGVLAVCVFTAAGYDEPLLALLKLDVTNAIVVDSASETDVEHRIVKLQDIPYALPTAGERLQKAALIRKVVNPGWELLVLDRQVGRQGERLAAGFFNRFLGAEWKLTPEAQTYRVFGTLTGVASTFYKNADREKWTAANYIFQNLDSAFRAKNLDLKKFVQGMDIQEEMKQEIRDELDKAKIPQKIKVDRHAADKLTANVRYRGEGNLLLTAPSDVYSQLVIEENISRAGLPVKQITITTRFWQRLRPRRR